jgi:hypothetical protein
MFGRVRPGVIDARNSVYARGIDQVRCAVMDSGESVHAVEIYLDGKLSIFQAIQDRRTAKIDLSRNRISRFVRMEGNGSGLKKLHGIGFRL